MMKTPRVKITASNKKLGWVMFWAEEIFNHYDYQEFRVKRSGVSGQHRVIDGKLKDISGVRHYIADYAFKSVLEKMIKKRDEEN